MLKQNKMVMAACAYTLYSFYWQFFSGIGAYMLSLLKYVGIRLVMSAKSRRGSSCSRCVLLNETVEEEALCPNTLIDIFPLT